MTTFAERDLTGQSPALDYGLGIRYPKLRLYFYSAIASDTVLFYTEGGDDNIWLRGKLVATIMPQLLPLLNGTMNVSQIIERLGADQRKVILSALKALKDKRIIEEGEVEPTRYFSQDYQDLYESQITFLSHYHNNAYQAQAHIFNSTVTLIDDNTSFGADFARNLSATGLGELRLVTAADQAKLSLQNRRLEDIEIPARLVDELAEEAPFTRFSAHRAGYEWLPAPSEVTPPLPSDATWEALTPLVQDTTLAVVLTEGKSTHLNDIINEMSLKQNFRWITINVSGPRLHIGPAFVPYATPCWRCYLSRTWANAVHEGWYDLADYLDSEYHSQPQRHTYGRLPMMPGLAASLGTSEILKLLTLYALGVYGRVMITDPVKSRTQSWEVLRLPRCAACGRDRQRVPSRIWYMGRPLPTLAGGDSSNG